MILTFPLFNFYTKLGHSLGFQHSGVGTSPYADKTGYMGFASNQIGYPLKAFVRRCLSFSLFPEHDYTHFDLLTV